MKNLNKKQLIESNEGLRAILITCIFTSILLLLILIFSIIGFSIKIKNLGEENEYNKILAFNFCTLSNVFNENLYNADPEYWNRKNTPEFYRNINCNMILGGDKG